MQRASASFLVFGFAPATATFLAGFDTSHEAGAYVLEEYDPAQQGAFDYIAVVQADQFFSAE